jgi:MoaA/NifB/PqqE/SkfB family radical SAM enzyme
MCHIWQNPTVRKEEVSLETLKKVPHGIEYLNLSGGEPTLRDDLMEIVDLLYPRAMQLEISSNGLHPERLEPIVRKYPGIKIRFSLEGIGDLNDRIRGEKDGFKTKFAGLLKLKQLGGRDLGFGSVIQDDNASGLVELFKLCRKHGVEYATSALHNGFQFHKNDNVPYDRLRVAKQIEGLITAQLRTWDVKTWFRGYVNLGLIAKVLGQDRLLPCTAGSSFIFIDPWSDMFACNVRPDLKMGNLQRQSWDEILNGPLATSIRGKVGQCKQNCWMVGSAKTAMRHPKFTKVPRFGPFMWVLRNKLRATLGLRIPFEHYVDYSRVFKDTNVPRRVSYLDQPAKRKAQTKDDPHYTPIGEFFNR